MLTAIYRQEWRSYNSRLPVAQLDMWLSISISLSLPIRAFGGLYSRIPKLTYSSYPQT